MRSSKDIVHEALVNEVESGLVVCTPEQQTRFRKFFPAWPDYPQDVLESALRLVQRTIDKNGVKV